MRLILDEDVPHPLGRALSDHDVRTVSGMGWSGVRNGELLELIARGAFDVFVTGDKNLARQQRLRDRPFAIVVLSAINWSIIRNHVTAISHAIRLAGPGAVKSVECGVFLPTRDKRKRGQP